MLDETAVRMQLIPGVQAHYESLAILAQQEYQILLTRCDHPYAQSLRSKRRHGRNRARTCDLFLVREALSQLSYPPTSSRVYEGEGTMATVGISQMTRGHLLHALRSIDPHQVEDAGQDNLGRRHQLQPRLVQGHILGK